MQFGTDGWRAVISDTFTMANVRRVAQALADYVVSGPHSTPVVAVGYDTRFLSRRYAEEVAGVLAANAIGVLFSARATPSPVVSFVVKHRQLAGGVMITASHNPPEYNGIKFKGDYGGSALPEMTSQIEARLQANTAEGREPLTTDFSRAVGRGQVEFIDPRPEYFARLQELVDMEKVRSLKLPVVIDPMYGAGQGYLREFLAEDGLKVVEIRGEINPAFGGVNPEPIAKNLAALATAVREAGAVAGFATDGDADRVGAMDHEGNFVDSHRIFALLLQHLAGRRGWEGDVVKTFSTTQMVDILAGRYGRKLHITPVGFKYICELMLAQPILIGGEESGGIGITRHIPERDGLFNSLLLMEIMAATGKNLQELIVELMAAIGPHYYDRVDLHLGPEEDEDFRQHFVERLPDRLAGQVVERCDRLDGVKLFLAGGRWILFRASGTEPVVRVYAEAPSPDEVAELLAAGRELLERR
ncbi:MAG: phosphoglucomutase/phosphomannomutase family protein [Clostridia bacterium]|nr:MAG: phosphoglucomutase/phosphomannomutase family protein [Clostridia bacterium]